MKICQLCKIERPLADYHRNRTTKDGLQSRCKECAKLRNSDPAYIAYQQQYNKSMARVDVRDAYVRPSTAKKRRALTLVRKAVRKGKIVRLNVCSECGKEGYTEFHHDDYSCMLQVHELCRSCHTAWHSIHGESPNA